MSTTVAQPFTAVRLLIFYQILTTAMSLILFAAFFSKFSTYNQLATFGLIFLSFTGLSIAEQCELKGRLRGKSLLALHSALGGIMAASAALLLIQTASLMILFPAQDLSSKILFGLIIIYGIAFGLVFLFLGLRLAYKTTVTPKTTTLQILILLNGFFAIHWLT